MSSLGFDNYVEPLKMYLQKYREANKGDKSIMGSSEGESSGTAGFESVDDGASTTSTNTVVFAYDLGQGHVPVQPNASGNGTNFTVG